MSLVLSTSWNAARYEEAEGLIAQIQSIGFKEIELSFNLTRQIVEGICDLRRRGQISVASVHNFCPIPEGISRKKALPDCYSMSSPDETVRQKALKYTRASIDTASRSGAKAVVLHCGRVEMPDYTRRLIGLYVKGNKDSPEFDQLKSAFIKQRRELAQVFFENTMKSLKELSPYAFSKGVRLGVENRFYYREIPSLEEIGIILDAFRGQNIYYWHDTGHAQIMDYLGFARHKDFLDRYAGDMLGIHLHGVSAGEDHCAPAKGELDFAFLTPYLRKETLKVIEAHEPAEAADLKESKKYLETLWNGKI